MNLELIEYVRKSLARGNSIEKIKKKLLETGWKPYQVDEVINIVNSERGFETEEKHKKARNIFLIFAGAVILISIFLFIYLFSSSPRAVSDLDLLNGVYLELNKGDSVEFNLEEKERVLSIDTIEEGSIIVIVGEPFVFLELKIDQTKEIDLTEDGAKDLKFILKKIERKRINLFIQAIEEEICEEDWECTSWGVCINGYKGRVCLDNNYCGTYYEMPNEEIVCESFELNCEDQGGEICSLNYICSLEVIISLDSADCCLGICELNETV